MAAWLAGKAGTESPVISYLAPAKCAAFFFFFFVLEWLKVREEGKNATALKELLCNRVQIAVLPGGGGAAKVER